MSVSGQVISIQNTATVGNLSIGLNTGNSLTFEANAVATQNLNISGTLTKTNTTGTVNFFDNAASASTSYQLNVSIGTVNMTGGGTFNFGGATRKIQSFVANTGITMSNNDVTRPSVISFNVLTDYSLGNLNFSGNSSKTINLINTTSFPGYARSVTVSGISQSSGTAATINGSAATSNTGSATTLNINAATGQSYSTINVFSDGATGSTLAITKLGAGSQTLSGTNTYTGNTTVSAGTLLINGSTAGGSAVLVTGGSAASAVLGGTGTIGGTVSFTTAAGGILAVGGAGAVGDLTTGALTAAVASNISLELNAAADSSDLLKSSSITATNFTLDLTNLGGTFSNGQAFQIFQNQAGNSPVISGTFAAVNKPALSGGLTWDESALYSTGTLFVVPEPSTWSLLAFSLTAIVLLRRHNRA